MSWKPLAVLSLLLTTNCAATPSSVCPLPVWPDPCTTEWPINTPHPACECVEDKYARQRCLLTGEKDCDK